MIYSGSEVVLITLVFDNAHARFGYAILREGFGASAAAKAAAMERSYQLVLGVKLAYSRLLFYALYDALSSADISNSHNAPLIMKLLVTSSSIRQYRQAVNSLHLNVKVPFLRRWLLIY